MPTSRYPGYAEPPSQDAAEAVLYSVFRTSPDEQLSTPCVTDEQVLSLSFSLDPDTRVVQYGTQRITLGKRRFETLETLHRADSELVPYEELLRNIPSGPSRRGTLMQRLYDLRCNLGEIGLGANLVTVPYHGAAFDQPGQALRDVDEVVPGLYSRYGGLLLATKSEKVTLSELEALALRLLREQPTEPVDNAKIAEALWPGASVDHNKVAVVVYNLRSKLGQVGVSSLVANNYGRGYSLIAPATK